MKNFWLQRRKKRELAKVVDLMDTFAKAKRAAIATIRGFTQGGLFPWRKKKDSKTQP